MQRSWFMGAMAIALFEVSAFQRTVEEIKRKVGEAAKEYEKPLGCEFLAGQHGELWRSRGMPQKMRKSRVQLSWLPETYWTVGGSAYTRCMRLYPTSSRLILGIPDAVAAK